MQVYLDYINLIEQYEPQNFIQRVIKEYALEGNLIRTSSNLNREIEPHDITQASLSKPAPNDTLHKEIRRLYMKRANIKKSHYRSYPYQ